LPPLSISLVIHPLTKDEAGLDPAQCSRAKRAHGTSHYGGILAYIPSQQFTARDAGRTGDFLLPSLHLTSIGIAIAATCEREDLTMFGRCTGAALFDRSRESITSSTLEPHIHVHGRRKITLATGPLYQRATLFEQDDIE
jgi:hypothetical protein